jgi:hypothetical protein
MKRPRFTSLKKLKPSPEAITMGTPTRRDALAFAAISARWTQRSTAEGNALAAGMGENPAGLRNAPERYSRNSLWPNTKKMPTPFRA